MSTTNDGDVSSPKFISTANAITSKPEVSSTDSEIKAHKASSEKLDRDFSTLLGLLQDPLDSEFEGGCDALGVYPSFKKALGEFNNRIQSGMTDASDPEVGAAAACFRSLRWYPDTIWEWNRILNGQEQSSGDNFPLLGNRAILHAKIYSYADHWHLTALKTVAFHKFLVTFATLNRCGADYFNPEDHSRYYNIFNPAHRFTSQDRDLMDVIFRELVSDENLRSNQDILPVFLYGLVRFRDSSLGNSLCTWYRHEYLAPLLAPARIESIRGFCSCSHDVGYLVGCEPGSGCEHGSDIPCEKRPICCQFCLQ